MKINQQAIATKLNLSTATVSKSLRNNSEIHPRTRAQVIKLASQLGYRPAPARLDKAKSGSKEMLSICLLLQSDAKIGSSATSHANLVLAGMSEAAHAAHASVIVHYVPLRDRERVLEPSCQPVAMREGKLSGLVLQHYYPAEIVRQLAQQLPCVSIVRHSPGLRIDCLDLDSSQAMDVVVNRLYELGHRRIGFLGALNTLSDSFNKQAWHQERFAAFIQALMGFGVAYDSAAAYPLGSATMTEAEFIDRVVAQSRSGVTAWVTASDTIGYSWMQHLTARGIRIPSEISITGVDAAGGGAEDGQRLTSVRVPFEAMGRAAVKLLVQRILEPASPIQRIGFEGQLVEGQTTGRVAK